MPVHSANQQKGDLVRAARRFRPAGRTLTGVAGVVLACAAVLSTTGPAQAATAHPHHSGRIHLTAAQAAEWRRDTATPAGRERILSALQSAFGASAVVGAGPAVSRQAPTRGRTVVTPDLSYGITGDHFWVIASYLDVIKGGIDAGAAACRRALPEVAFVCNTAASVLKSWASGWGSASNHGVWAAIYWWPPHWSGGRY